MLKHTNPRSLSALVLLENKAYIRSGLCGQKVNKEN